jgi:hypothetical protein
MRKFRPPSWNRNSRSESPARAARTMTSGARMANWLRCVESLRRFRSKSNRFRPRATACFVWISGSSQNVRRRNLAGQTWPYLNSGRNDKLYESNSEFKAFRWLCNATINGSTENSFMRNCHSSCRSCGEPVTCSFLNFLSPFDFPESGRLCNLTFVLSAYVPSGSPSRKRGSERFEFVPFKQEGFFAHSAGT